MLRTTSYDVLSAKIGPTGSSVGVRKNWKKWSKHSKVLSDFAHVGAKTPGQIDPKIFLVIYVRDTITCFKFGDDRFRGIASAEGQILPFPIDFDGRPYNTLTLPCERVICGRKFVRDVLITQYTVYCIVYCILHVVGVYIKWDVRPWRLWAAVGS